MTIKQILITNAIILFVVISIIIVVEYRHQRRHAPLSERFLHKATEVISNEETVETYTDLNNDNICYLYYFNNQSEAVALTCTPKQPSLY